jgi:hypothetical protein
MPKSLIDFIQDDEVIKNRVKLLKHKLRLCISKKMSTTLYISRQKTISWNLESYVRIKYILGEPL